MAYTRVMRGADATVKVLRAEGVELVVGTIGHASFELADALIDSGIKNFHPAVEYGGAFIVEGFNRARGRASGVVAGTAASGPPIIWGLTNANADSIPIVAIVGSDSLRRQAKSQIQSTPSAAMAAPAIKHAERVVQGELIPHALRGALASANLGRQGAALVEVPYNLMAEKFEYADADFGFSTSAIPRPRGDAYEVSRAVELLTAAERPAILAGGGVTAAGAEQALRAFVEHARIPVSVTTTARGAFPEDHPLCLGHSGVYGSRCANTALDEADVLLAIGCRFADRGYAQARSDSSAWKLIHVDIDTSEIGRVHSPDIAIAGDAKSVLEDMLLVAKERSRRSDLDGWHSRIQGLKAAWLDELNEMMRWKTDGVHPGRFFAELRKVLRRDAVLCTDPTMSMIWALETFDATSPKTHWGPAGWASTGWALPAALGAKLALPERQVVSVSGDWSFHYNFAELATVDKLGLPVVCVVFDDNAQLCNTIHQAAVYGKGRTPWALHRNPDFVTLGQLFGLKTARIESNEQVAPVIDEALRAEEPYLVSVKIVPTVPAPTSFVSG